METPYGIGKNFFITKYGVERERRPENPCPGVAGWSPGDLSLKVKASAGRALACHATRLCHGVLIPCYVISYIPRIIGRTMSIASVCSYIQIQALGYAIGGVCARPAGASAGGCG